MIDPHLAQNFADISLLTEFSEGEEVACVTIDGLELSNCDLIKIDVEGMELPVIRGGLQTIRRLSPILYVKNDKSHQSTTMIRYLAALHYDLYWHFPPLYNPSNYFANTENTFGDTVPLNMVRLPEGCSWDPEGLSPVEIPKRKQISA
jgi:hypothetical protein